MPAKKTSGSAKKPAKATAKVKDLSASKAGAAKTQGGFKQGWPVKWSGASSG